MLESISQNKILLSIIMAGIVSQGLKTIIHMSKEKRGFLLSDIIITGGMPSTHSALVSSLFAILLFEEGLSVLTIIAFVLFIIVVTDSMGVRRTVGEEGKAINKIIKVEHIKIAKMHLSLGHEPIEVLAGIFLGFIVSIIVWFFV